MNQQRQPKGVRTGGQFAPGQRGDDVADLDGGEEDTVLYAHITAFQAEEASFGMYSPGEDLIAVEDPSQLGPDVGGGTAMLHRTPDMARQPDGTYRVTQQQLAEQPLRLHQPWRDEKPEPPKVSWPDLRDHYQIAGEPTAANIVALADRIAEAGDRQHMQNLVRDVQSRADSAPDDPEFGFVRDAEDYTPDELDEMVAETARQMPQYRPRYRQDWERINGGTGPTVAQFRSEMAERDAVHQSQQRLNDATTRWRQALRWQRYQQGQWDAGTPSGDQT